MNRPPDGCSVKPFIFESEISKLLNLSTKAHAVFWLALLSGAASVEGWVATEDNRRDAALRYRGKSLGAKAFQEGLNELIDEDLVRCTVDGAAIVVYLQKGSVFAEILQYTGGVQGCGLQASNKLKKNTQSVLPHMSCETPGSSTENVYYKNKNELTFCNESAKKLTERLVDFWGAKSKRTRVRVLRSRVALVRARIRDGYSVEDLYQAVAGVCYSPFHREGGYDTFEVALRTGDQVEKGQRLWYLHAPIQYIEEFQARTGQVVTCRADEMEQRVREKHLADDYLSRLNAATQAHDAREEKKREEDRRDCEATALALAGMGGDEEGSDG